MKKRFRIRRILLASILLLVAGGAAIIGSLGAAFPHQSPIPLGPADAEIAVLGSKIRYRSIEGEGPPILLVHGNNLSIDDWEPMVAHLKGRKIFALDLIGYAGSDRPDLPYDIECQRQYLVAFIEALGIEKPVIVGHSMGGTVVGWTAAKSSDRIAGAVLIAPPGIPGSLVYRWPKNLLCQPGPINRFGFRVANTSLFKSVFPTSIARQGLGVTGSYSSAYTDALADIAVPTLLIWSSGDDRCLMSYAEMYRDRIRDFEFAEVPASAGHMVPMTYPEGTARLVADFVEQLSLRNP